MKIGYRPEKNFFQTSSLAYPDRARRSIDAGNIKALFLKVKGVPASTATDIQHPSLRGPNCALLERPPIVVVAKVAARLRADIDVAVVPFDDLGSWKSAFQLCEQLLTLGILIWLHRAAGTIIFARMAARSTVAPRR